MEGWLVVIRLEPMKGKVCQSELTVERKKQETSVSVPPNPKSVMESRKLAAILSSLISQLLLLLLHIFPSNPNPNPNSHSLLPLLLYSQHLNTTLALTLTRKRKRKRKRKRNSLEALLPTPNPLTRTPDPFRNTFLMTSSTFEWLSGLLEPLLDCRDPAHLPPLNLPAPLRLAIGLSRLASASDYPSLAARFSVPLPVAKFCVKHLCRVLCTNFRFWLSFPPDLRQVSLPFHSLSSLPNCCGILFCVRFHSLAAQLVVDSSLRILTLAAGFPSHKSNSQILKSSSLFSDIQNGTLLNAPSRQYLIADSHYPLLPWLMVPFPHPLPSSLQHNFNAAHRLMRLPALRTAASLRNWAVLSQPLAEDPKMTVAYIAACSILHNCLLMREDFSALASEFQDSHTAPSTPHDEPVSSQALAFRDSLAAIATKTPHSSS
ncbi:protein ALP1-like isoform X1 [Cajanus cajan]|nr:protein ALP1-like isoform X1 [Cajanus cajan]